MPLIGYLQFVAALVFVLALIGAAAFVARRFGLGHGVRPTPGRRRLAVLESLPLDGKRRLVLIGRDDVAHLLVLGPGSETVVEHGITLDREPFTAVLARQGAGEASGAAR
jgi:flagellar protein FliO/FliZ